MNSADMARAVADVGAGLYLVRDLPLCDQPTDEPDIDCLLCEDRGWFVPPLSDLRMPCQDCRRGEWDFWADLADEARRDR